ncbi:MAG: nitroreductase [Parasphingopyxis sp.]|uniref:nitroreductase n=1 Tax=Parasphingopyxis sp. TaxID=1920299 RepID=UPI003F9F2999
MEELTVRAAIEARQSRRAFLDTPVDRATVERLLALASRSPSGSNMQPWNVYVVMGEKLEELKRLALEAIAGGVDLTAAEFEIYPAGMGETHMARRLRNAEDMFGAAGIARDDKAGRMMQMASNFRFFDAPVGMFFTIDRALAVGNGQMAHLGMFIQTLMLAAQAEGIDSCPQEAWAILHETVRPWLGVPDEQMLYCGLALGHHDPDAPINSLRTDRVPVSEFATFIGG